MHYVDMDNPALWLREMTFAGFYAHRTMTDVLPADHPIMENAMSSEYFVKARNLQLTDEDFRQLRGFKQKGYEKALRSVQAAQQLKLDIAAGKTNVKTAPNVPADKVFQAILDRYRGKVVLVNFWATWCPPCRQEMSHLQKDVIDRFAGEDLVVLPISRGEERKTVEAFIEKMGYTFPIGLDGDQSAYKKYASNYIPRSVVVGKDGKVVYVAVGYDQEIAKAIDNAIVEALK